MAFSGVGLQTSYFIQGMLKTGKYQFVSLGGAVKHEDYRPIKTQEWGDDWLIIPIQGYGNQESLRSIIRIHRPDIVWIITDPRSFGFLFRMENEIRPLASLVYNTIWDNFPYPKFNKPAYESMDMLVPISKVTENIVKNVAPKVECHRIPHFVDMNIYKKLPEKDIVEFRKQNFPDKEFIFFWNNRNAKRKQTGTVILGFKNFIERNKIEDKCMLILHTDPKDPYGQDLNILIKDFGLDNGQVKLSQQKMSHENLAFVYNAIDCTINISNAEGFGLSTFESLACETPILVNDTGGLQEQARFLEEVTQEEMEIRGKNEESPKIVDNGIIIQPRSKSLIGSQEVSYIYEDSIILEDYVKALEMMYNLPKHERDAMGRRGREHLEKHYNPEDCLQKWDEVLTNLYEKNGSWDTRKNYKPWEMRTF